MTWTLFWQLVALIPWTAVWAAVLVSLARRDERPRQPAPYYPPSVPSREPKP